MNKIYYSIKEINWKVSRKPLTCCSHPEYSSLPLIFALYASLYMGTYHRRFKSKTQMDKL